MPYITYEVTCPICQVHVIKKRTAANPPPVYCSIPCANRARAGAGHPTRKHHYTEAMEDAIRVACRATRGGLRRLWETDARFTGIPYPSVRRHAWILGCIRSGPASHWSADELAYATEAYRQGRCLDSIAQSLRRRGWHRSPAAIMARMIAEGAYRSHGDTLSCRQVALAFGVDGKVVGRWLQRGWLPIHHRSDGVGERRYVHLDALRRFVVAYPSVVAQTHPDLVWLIGLLTMPTVGLQVDAAEEASPGFWMNHTTIRAEDPD